MVTYNRYDIVFQEIPNEISLAFSIEGCPNNCVGCHSPQLRRQDGAELTKESLMSILNEYANSITCVLFLGGDAFHEELKPLFLTCRQELLKTAFYSGNENINGELIPFLDYYKIGNYNECLGGLNNPKTNQKLYKIEDITNKFWEKG